MFPKSLDPLFIAQSLTIGAAVSTVFGTIWVVEGINAAHAPAQVTLPLFAVLAVLALAMAVACIRLFATARLYPPSGDQAAMKQANRYITIVSVLQIIASVVGPALLAYWGRANLALPETVVTVGLLLLAFALLLRLPHYYIIGALLCIIPIVSVLCVPATIVVAGGVQSWMVINGVVCGLINLGLGVANIVLTVRIRRGYAQNSQAQEFMVPRFYSDIRK